MQQPSYDGPDLAGESRPWRIAPGWLIQIEAAWLIAAALIGWQLSLLPPDAWGAQLYRHGPGGNALGLFALGNAVGYLIYEEVRMVFSGMFHREKVADVKARESKFAAERAEAQAELKAAEADLAAKRADLAAERAEAEANAARAESKAEQAEAEARAARAEANAARAEARAARAAAVIAAQPEGSARTAAAARQAALAEVAAWYERQQAAQRAGLPFDEPPPGYGSGG